MRTSENVRDHLGRETIRTSFEGEETLTVQSEAQQADIGFILGQYKAVGIVSNLNTAEARFADISEMTDYADAMLMAKEAETEFLKLPSKMREIFGHDVGNWLDTAHDKDKRDALVAAGFIEAPDDPATGVGSKDGGTERSTDGASSGGSAEGTADGAKGSGGGEG